MFNELKAAVSPFFRRYPSINWRVAAQVDRRVAVSRQGGFLFFRVPKAGNSTVSSTLYTHFTGRENDPYGSSREIRRYFPRAHSLSRQDIADLPVRFFLFSFVRNPYSRLASAYLEKVLLAPAHYRAKQIVHRYYKRGLDQKVSFLEFCRFVNGGGLFKDAHWYPQVTFIPCGVAQLHFLGRLESLDSDLKRLFRELFNEELPQVARKVGHATGASDKLKGLYCDESVALVRKNYQSDFDALGYSLDPHWL